ncbi:MAG: cation-translocating P-type ATPase [Lachnospiraceae bacterium]|nr:cation-translocating P-type ATPase [Lachnospiraceae bacterium]
MLYHNTSSQETIDALHSNALSGLTDAQVTERLEKYGPNKLKEKRKKTTFERFLAQFKDVMILILLVAAAISFVIAIIEKDPSEFIEPALILLIVILNAIMGVVQESRAEKAIDALKSMSAPHARVIRDGTEKKIDAADLVPGDIIFLEAGDFVPADARLLTSAGLKSEESALTGESVPSEKNADEVVADNAPIGDRTNMVFSGCSITYGTASAVVTATGMDTEMGKIANLLDAEEDGDTPLQQKLADLGKYLGMVAIAACAIIFIVGMVSGTMKPIEIFMVAVSLAVSAIPEGLPAIVTIVLSIGVTRLAKQNAVIRRLPAVETLGGASIICSDKTGTLTQNRMTLMKAYVDGEADLEDISENNTEKVREILKLATLCCDGSVVFSAEGEQHMGDPTETSIVVAAHKNGMEKDDLNNRFKRVASLPFDSDRKLMTTINEIDGKYIVITKGAFDCLAEKCITGDLEKAKKLTEDMSSQALRVLAVATKEIPAGAIVSPSPKDIESGLTFRGLVGMIDPPRPEVRDAVAVCRKAGIRPVMITGDHVVTASAIAKDLGIMRDGDMAITGTQLDAWTDREFDEKVEGISVYARVSPENKIRIVKAWQRRDQIVSMTGDGVNDAPALKAADIGCAMGITGTDVAKGSADMTLMDDNFTTIVSAVREGRGIYANIKKVVGFLLGTNIGEVLVVFLAMILWKQAPLLSMQLLWINLVTDSLPAIALGMEPVEKDVMDKAPRPKMEGLFANGFGVQIVLQGIMFGGLSLAAFFIGWKSTGEIAGGQTLAFMTLSMSQVVQAFNMRSMHSLFKIGPFSNTKLDGAALISTLMVALVMFTPLNALFGLIYLPADLYLIGLAFIFTPVVVMEIVKALGLMKV